ncbi:nitroreductase family protein [Caproicibacterium sp. NSD3]
MLKEIESRRSIRKYLTRDVTDKQILDLIESARLAPSGDNTQPWNFIVVRSTAIKNALISADHNQGWIKEAPVLLVCTADITCRKKDGPFHLDENSPEPELKQIIRDTAIAIENLLLEAEHDGLAACWTGWFDQKDVRPILGVPENQYICGIIPIGYSAEARPAPRPRRPLETMVYYDSWGNSIK